MESPVKTPTVNKHPVNKGGAPRLYYSAQLMRDRIDEYIKLTESKEQIYTNEKTGIPTIRKTPLYYGRLLLHLGFASRQSAVPYEDGQYDDDNNQFSDVLAYGKALCGADIAEGAMMGDYTDRVAMAVLAHDHGIVQKTEVNHTGNVLHTMQLEPGQAEAMLQRALEARQRRLAPVIDGEVISSKTEPIPVAIPVDGEETTE